MAFNKIKLYVELEHQYFKRSGYTARAFQILTSLLLIVFYSFFGKTFWPKSIENEMKFTYIIQFIVHNSAFIISNLILFIFYKYNMFLQYKIDKNPWPWEEKSENYSKWSEQLKKTIKTLIFNHLFLAPFIAALPMYSLSKSLYRMDYESLPSPFEIFWQILFNGLCDDFVFYWTHRILHWDKIYGYIHKKHHEYVSSIGITAEYAHPLEFIFGNILPANTGKFILGNRMHAFTVILGTWIKLFSVTEAHSGYAFPWSPFFLNLFQIPTDYHAYHHLNYNGNYGNSMLFDVMYGTVNESFKENSKKECAELERREVGGKLE